MFLLFGGEWGIGLTRSGLRWDHWLGSLKFPAMELFEVIGLGNAIKPLVQHFGNFKQPRPVISTSNRPQFVSSNYWRGEREGRMMGDLVGFSRLNISGITMKDGITM
ncbi:hypothetical protein CLV42_11814 [Chitinophaga ginsengisoli]|uniref:Uncharacterized protein n=1 Tax=Chitinophaga ginsengisoli TaxID=363837 RepID=A0A2P8FNL7_9BACT|nr:hypothetical protein CLV42_11814 [Chitinophaga ginsengisoli]